MEQYTQAKMNALIDKNKKRIEDIQKKAKEIAADEEKEMDLDQAIEHLAQIQIDKIEDPVKAHTRGKAADDANLSKAAKMFYDKAKELGFKDDMIEIQEVSESIMSFDEFSKLNEESES